MRLKRGLIAVALLLMLVAAGVASAREIQQGDQCVIEAGRTVEGNLLVLCRTLVIDGRVTGNVLGAATTAIINGAVEQNVYMLAGQLDVRGAVGDDVHFAGLVLRIHPEARFTDERADIITVSLSTSLLEGATVPGSILDLGYQLQILGTVGGEVSFWGSSLSINGEIGGNVDAQVGDADADVTQLETLLIPVPLDIALIQPGLRVEEGARIAGQLTYSGPTEGEIAAGALAREPLYRPVVVQPDFTTLPIGEDQSRSFGLYLAQVVREFLSLLAVGVVGLLLIPRTLQSPIRNLQARPLVCLGVGLLTFIISFVAVPFVILFTVLIIIIASLLQVNELTIAVGTVLTVADIGIASTIFFVVIFVSRIILCFAIGRWVVRALIGDDGSLRRTLLALVIGVALLSLIASIPIIGWIFNGLAAFLGLGAIMTLIQARAEVAREAPTAPRYVSVSPPTLPRRASEERVVVPPPPPMLDSSPRPLGMDNLPEGFAWWDE